MLFTDYKRSNAICAFLVLNSSSFDCLSRVALSFLKEKVLLANN